MQFCLEIETCDSLNYTMDHSKIIVSTQKEEFISSFEVLLITILNETSKPPVNKTHFFNIAHLLLKYLK